MSDRRDVNLDSDAEEEIRDRKMRQLASLFRQGIQLEVSDGLDKVVAEVLQEPEVNTQD